MNRRQILLPLFLLCAGALSHETSHAAERVILYGDDDYAPYSFVEGGKFKGIYVDMLKLAAKRLAPHFTIELQPRPWKRGLSDLELGLSFGLFPPGLKKERNYIQPYSVPLYRETVVLFCNEDIMKTPRRVFPADFAGLTVGVNAGFLLSERLAEAARTGTVVLQQAKGNDTNLKKLALKRIDCYASDRAAALYSAKHLHMDTRAATPLREAVELSGEDTYIGYSASNNPAYKAAFIEEMNAAITAIRHSGEAARIEASYR
ncbi:transporter substrate-binding domain-containing protein [Oxalobacteraceae bacterium]|nr:transporter substrate-binding domain-containing protein [Oxalobacteraceae bacterium]